MTLDGETFGHHKKGYYRFLSEIVSESRMYDGIEILKLSDLIRLKEFYTERKMRIIDNSWAGEKESWINPYNPKIKKYLDFIRAKIKTVEENKNKPFYDDLLVEIQPSTSSCGE